MGVFVVNFRMAFFSDAISHSAFTGVALGLLTGINPVISVVVFGVLIGLLVVYFKEKSEMSYDTVIGVFFSFAVSLGIVIVSSSKNLIRNFHSFLYGDILLIDTTDILITVTLALAVMIFIFMNFDELVLLGLDETYAATHVKSPARLKYMFSFLLGLVVTVSIKTVGILLVTALLIVPAASARIISGSLKSMFFLTILIGLISGIGGLTMSLKLNSSTGASIVILSCMMFLLCTVWKTITLRI
jgi:zinc transport system permease protein